MLVTLSIEKKETPTHDFAVFQIEGIVVLRKGMLFQITAHKKHWSKFVDVYSLSLEAKVESKSK